MMIKIIGRILGLAACITSIWIIIKILTQGYIQLIEPNLFILWTELMLMVAGTIILIFDIKQRTLEKVKNAVNN